MIDMIDKNENIDQTNFLDLKALNPEEVIARTGCRFDKTHNQYLLDVWGCQYCVDLKTNEVRPQGLSIKTYNNYLYLFILFFLLKSKNILLSGKWVSQKDIKGGEAFFRGPHTLPVDKITDRFGDDIDLFKKECKKLNGVTLDLADAAFVFQITPTLPVAVLFWQGDEDFPSEAKLLFDSTIDQHLPLDIIYALAVEICHQLVT
jgi:hypothetical protein